MMIQYGVAVNSVGLCVKQKVPRKC